MARGLTAVLVLCAVLTGCTSVVRSGLSEHEAGALLLALDDAAIGASMERRGVQAGYEVRVARGELARALRIAQGSGELQAQPGFDKVLAEAPLVPTPGEERARQAFATAGELARSIEALPGVRRARVHLTPPEPRAALDAPPSNWRASVLIQRGAGTPPIDDATIRTLLRGAAHELPDGNVAIVQSELAAPRSVEHARVGPFTVAKRDAPVLRATLAGALMLNALLAAMLIVVVARRRARAATA